MKYSDTLREALEPFVAKFSNAASAKSFITEMNKILERVDTEVAPMIAGNKNLFSCILKFFSGEESERLMGQIKNSLHWLTNSLDKKDDVGALKYKMDVEPLARELRTKYAHLVATAKEYLVEVDKVVSRVDSELGDIIAGKELAVTSDVKI
jgi:hypothetical protein